MEKRKYLSVEDIYSRANGQGVFVGTHIYGENTRVRVIDHRQTDKIIFLITFEDLNYVIVEKVTPVNRECGRYVEYAQDLLEEDSREEYYKVALIVIKKSLISSNKQTASLLRKFHKGKHAWPIDKSNYKSYEGHLNLNRLIVASIDTKESDLKYFEQYRSK